MKIAERFRAALAAFRSGPSAPRAEVSDDETEDRSTESMLVRLSDPDTWLTDLFGGGKSAGVNVNRESALGLPAFWRAVILISGDVAKLPLRVIKKIPEGGRETDTRHPAHYLIRRRPNPQLHSFAWRRRMQGDVLCCGNGYTWIERAGSRPVALWPLPPEYVQTESTGLGEWRYWLEVPGEPRAPIRAADMLHFRSFERSDSIEGISVVERLRMTIGEGLAQGNYGAGFFERGARPTATIKAPPGQKIPEAEQQKMEARLAEVASSVHNAHKIIVLPRGLELVPWSMSNTDAEFLGSREFKLIDIANAFGLPPHKLGHSARTSYASLEEENRAYLDESLDTHLVAFEAELDLKLLTETQNRRETHSCKFKRQALLRANLAARQAYYSSALAHQWMNRDEVRELEDLNPIPGGDGSRFLIPAQLVEPDRGGGDDSSNSDTSADTSDTSADTSSGSPEARSLASARLSRTLDRLERRCAKMGESARESPENRSYLRDELEGDLQLCFVLSGASNGDLLRVPDAADLAAGALVAGAGARGARELLATVRLGEADE